MEKQRLINNEKFLYYIGIIFLISLSVIMAIYNLNNVLNDNLQLLEKNFSILNNNKNFIQIIVIISQIIIAFFSVIVDSVIEYFIILFICKRKVRIKTFRVPIIYGNISALILNSILLFYFNNFKLEALKTFNLFPFALILKCIVLYLMLKNKINEIDKKREIIITLVFFVISYLFTILNIITIN